MGILILGDFMIIRLGYVAISKSLENITSSHTLNYTNFQKSNNNINKIYEIIDKNLTDLEEIIKYNIKNNIHFYRLTSKLIPLDSHKDVHFEYIDQFRDKFLEISTLINNSNMRVDMHPDQFTVLNSVKKEVLDNTFRILNSQYQILEHLGIKNKVIILHVGSNVLGKDNAIKRFINNFKKLPVKIQKAIVIENDDKIYNIKDVLDLCNTLNIPFVLDYHHHICNGSKEIDIAPYYEKIFATWKKINPKIHFSSPKANNKKDMRSHNDYIDVDKFIEFIESIKKLPYNIDIMLEAKEKDEALFRLVRNLKYKTNYQFIDDTTFIV